MGYKFVDKIVRRKLPIDPTTKMVAVVIASHANEKTGISFPGIDTIGDLVGICRRSVTTHVSMLVRLGVVEIVSGGRGGRPRKTGDQFSTVYRVHPHAEISAENQAAHRAVSNEETKQRTARFAKKKPGNIRQKTKQPACQKPSSRLPPKQEVNQFFVATYWSVPPTIARTIDEGDDSRVEDASPSGRPRFFRSIELEFEAADVHCFTSLRFSTLWPQSYSGGKWKHTY